VRNGESQQSFADPLPRACDAAKRRATMYTLFRSVPLRNLLATQAPALLLSFVIAELFYKFHSFTLECLAFLVTWFVIDAVITSVSLRFKQRTAISMRGES